MEKEAVRTRVMVTRGMVTAGKGVSDVEWMSQGVGEERTASKESSNALLMKSPSCTVENTRIPLHLQTRPVRNTVSTLSSMPGRKEKLT